MIYAIYKVKCVCGGPAPKLSIHYQQNLATLLSRATCTSMNGIIKRDGHRNTYQWVGRYPGCHVPKTLDVVLIHNTKNDITYRTEDASTQHQHTTGGRAGIKITIAGDTLYAKEYSTIICKASLIRRQLTGNNHHDLSNDNTNYATVLIATNLSNSKIFDGVTTQA